tara:strand:- start:6009 stop:7646 length:1638 start_codon:yes stop_codon:yes gene_type:complete
MAVTTGSLFDKHSDRIEEIINRNIGVFLPSLDPMWRDNIVTSQGVGPADAIGRDMKIMKVFMGSMTGVLEQGHIHGDVGLYGDTMRDVHNKLNAQELTQTWPDPLNGPQALPYRLGIPMRSMMSNIMFTLGELQAEALPATIGEIVAPKLEGFAKNISHTLCNYWYVNQNDNYSLGTIASIVDGEDAGALDSASTEVRITIDEGTYDRFFVGQRVDIIDGSSPFSRRNDTAADNSQTNATRMEVYVSRVDELKGYVYLAGSTRTTGGATVAATAFHSGGAAAQTSAVNDTIVYAGSHNYGGSSATSAAGIAGMNSWLKSGASGNNNLYLLGDDRDTSNQIDVSLHPEFKSFTKAVSGVLTEHKLRQYLRRFHSAKNKYGQYIDCLVASDGVWLAYEATKIGRERLDRTNRLSSLSAEGSQDGFQFSMDGRTYTGYTSNYVSDGEVYGIRKGGGNWKRYVPPTPSGYGTFDRADSFAPFNFIASALTGTGTNKLPIYKTSSGDSGATNMVTEGVQMPGLLRMQLVPDQPAGMKLTGCTTDQVYSDN